MGGGLVLAAAKFGGMQAAPGWALLVLAMLSCQGHDKGNGILKPDGQRIDDPTAGSANRPLTTIAWLDSAKNIGRISGSPCSCAARISPAT